MQAGSHPSAFKGDTFGICTQCGKRGVYQGMIRNPAWPVNYQRCRACGDEVFNVIPRKDIRFI